jgi:hypothetical protein
MQQQLKHDLSQGKHSMSSQRYCNEIEQTSSDIPETAQHDRPQSMKEIPRQQGRGGRSSLSGDYSRVNDIQNRNDTEVQQASLP